MAPNIFGERVATYKHPAWHSLGPTFQEKISPKEAVILAGMDYEVGKYPLSADINGNQVQTPLFGLYREPTEDDPNFQYFGSVAKDYEVIQNTEIAEIIEPLSDLWPVETVGALGKGQTIFFTLNAGERQMAHDKFWQYFMVSDTKDGGHCLRVDTVDFRIVCGNTYRMGIKEASTTIALNHGRNPRKKLEAVSVAIEKMQQSGNVVMELLESLSKTKISKERMKKMVMELYPTPDLSNMDPVGDDPAYVRRMLNWKERVESTQMALVELYKKFNDEFPQFANSGYAFYNVAVELEDYKTGRNKFESALFGARARKKEQAFEMALATL